MEMYILSTLIMAFGGLGLFVFYLRRGQFDDIEDVKYQMFRDEDDNTKDRE